MWLNSLTMMVTQSFTQALYHLAAHPEYMKPMREEVEAVLADEGGWSKAALQKMRKVDSFLKECQRYEGLGARMSFSPLSSSHH